MNRPARYLMLVIVVLLLTPCIFQGKDSPVVNDQDLSVLEYSGIL
jgi:hypothetical protein